VPYEIHTVSAWNIIINISKYAIYTPFLVINKYAIYTPFLVINKYAIYTPFLVINKYAICTPFLVINKYAICTPFLVKMSGCQILDLERNHEFCCGSKNHFFVFIESPMYKTGKKIWSQVWFKTKFSSIHIAAN
jgi:hypothetical protein